MSDIDRRTTIQRLEYIKSMEWRDWAKDALQFAIDSLEVDEAYQLEYEISTGQRRCNKCKYYEGVHNVMGHAPCSYHKIGGVLWDWYCSQFESDISDHHKQNIQAYAQDFGVSDLSSI